MSKTLARLQWYLLEVLPVFVIASVILWLGDLTGVLDLLGRGLGPVVSFIGLPPEAGPVFLYGFFRRDFGAAGLYQLADRRATDRRVTGSGGGDADSVRAVRGSVLGDGQGEGCEDGPGHCRLHLPVRLRGRIRPELGADCSEGEPVKCALCGLDFRPDEGKTSLSRLSPVARLPHGEMPPLRLRDAGGAGAVDNRTMVEAKRWI